MATRTYLTPGVYVEEISTLPPSVAPVATAIPAFIGCTEKAPNRQGTEPVIRRIETMLEYESLFGGAPPVAFAVTATEVPGSGTPDLKVVRTPDSPNYYVYYGVNIYFQNGGGPCYIVSIGNDNSEPTTGLFKAGLDALEKEDEPTLILLTDAVGLDVSQYYNTLCPYALAQCAKLQDRFTIMDVVSSGTASNLRSEIEDYRTRVGMTDLHYGAAYYPYLQTALGYVYDEANVTVDPPFRWSHKFLDANQTGIRVTSTAQNSVAISGSADDISFDENSGILTILNGVGKTGNQILTAWTQLDNKPAGWDIRRVGDAPGSSVVSSSTNSLTEAKYVKIPGGDNSKGITVTYTGATDDGQVVIADGAGKITFAVTDTTNTLTITGPKGITGQDIVDAWKLAPDKVKSAGWDIGPAGPLPGSGVVASADGSAKGLTAVTPDTLDNLKQTQTALYHQIKARLAQECVVLPPSSAIAGVYARVDRERGVWKAPANVSLSGVIGPQFKISDEEQENMNIDPNSGKSVNAIRAFAGKGTLVWGARTLDGNSNEWRYVSVRRLFIMIEESIQKAIAQLVFEPNDATTWLKGKAMIDSFLYGLWEQGGLAGASSKDAYLVEVGLGKTMTPQNILDGYMIFQVHVAPVRPAEFVVLQFMQQLQTS